MNTKLRTEAKNDFENDVFKLMNNSVFEKAIQNIRNHRVIKLVTTNKRRNYLESGPNYHTTKMVFGKFISNTNEQNKRKND